MELLTDRQLRLLGFVGACNGSGYRPLPKEVQTWLDSPGARAPVTKFQDYFTAQVFRSFGSVFAAVPGTGETDVAHAVRMFWIADEERLLLTTLGRALLRASLRQQETQTSSDVVVLDREDPLAYAMLIGRLASFGAATLVDPYLRLEQLHDLVTQTQLARVLISKQYKDSRDVRAGMAIYLGGASREIQVRCSSDPDVHDRMVLTAEGGVHLLGHSLNGIDSGVASTLLIELPSAAAAGQAAKVDQWWKAADILEPTADPPSLAAVVAPAKKPPANKALAKKGAKQGSATNRAVAKQR